MFIKYYSKQSRNSIFIQKYFRRNSFQCSLDNVLIEIKIKYDRIICPLKMSTLLKDMLYYFLEEYVATWKKTRKYLQGRWVLIVEFVLNKQMEILRCALSVY